MLINRHQRQRRPAHHTAEAPAWMGWQGAQYHRTHVDDGQGDTRMNRGNMGWQRVGQVEDVIHREPDS